MQCWYEKGYYYFAFSQQLIITFVLMLFYTMIDDSMFECQRHAQIS